MSHYRTINAVVLLFAIAAFVAADEPTTKEQPEPPVRLQKKGRPNAEPPAKPPMPGEKKVDEKKPDRLRADDAKKDGEPDAAEEIDEKETLARVSKNMRSSEERLANHELGEPTKQVQRDILADLDLLIKLSQNPPQQDQNSQSDPSSSPSGADKSKGKQQQKQQQMSSSQKRQQRRQQAKGNKQGQQRPGQEGQPQQPMDTTAGNNPGGGKGGTEGGNKIADIYKEVWGHLPESMRAEMNAYSREQFMAKYEDVIKKYYAAISEKSRRKGD